jgi:hypothetical protein
MADCAGRVAITWPPPSDGTLVLGAEPVMIHDDDTGEQIIDAVAMRLAIGDESGWHGPVMVELTRIVDADGVPSRTVFLTEAYLAHRAAGCEDEDFDGRKYRTGVFQYAVAEMRAASAASASGGVEAEYDLDTGVRREEPQD